MKKHAAAWTPERLDQYLTDPQAFAPGAEMDIISPDPAERVAIIDHLKTPIIRAARSLLVEDRLPPS